MLVGGDPLHADAGQVVDGRAQPDRLGDRRGAGLELVRRRGVGGRAHGDGLDHLAAAEERREVLQQLLAAPEHADAGRRQHLVAGEGDEVGLQRLDVQHHVRRGLRGVDHDQRADRLGLAHDGFDRVDGAQQVGDQGEGDHLGLLGDQLVDVGQVEPALVGQPEPLQLRAGALREQLPRDDVGVVLHLRDDDLGLGVHPVRLVRPGQHVGDQVERLGGVLGEHHLVAARRVDESRDLVPGALVQRRGLLGEHVHAAVDVGVVPLVVGVQGVSYTHL